MRRFAALLALACPAVAAAHGELPVALEAPAGPGNVVEAGAPFTARWHDTDVGGGTLTLFARRTPAPPYVASWPIEGIEGEVVFGPVAIEDRANEAAIDTAALGPGHWFLWAAVHEADGHSQYVPPAGVLTVVEPGGTAAPSVFVDAPARNDSAAGPAYEVRLSTWPAEASVVVDLFGSIDDVEGTRLRLLATATGGTDRLVPVDVRCAGGGSGWLTLQARVRGGGAAFAAGRVLLDEDDVAGAAPCPAGTGDAPAPGGGCSSAGAAPAGLLALLGTRRRRRTR
ncbi:hypothetical protein [Vulgatibacter sp.]|uniref:hypothetical protein n=1 Tax=Vulgatibacter sp. TaxID=1971226 RepID=UPI0035647D3F